MPKKIVLAYSGGLDTSVAIQWLIQKYGADIITLTVDLGAGHELDGVTERAIETGASKALMLDGRDVFAREFVLPALQAGLLYEGIYPLATALGRPLIARYLTETALKEGADAVAHGCTGKGNDQVRFDISVGSLAPNLEIVGPAREWGMSREQEIEYAIANNIPIKAKLEKLFSVDENLWGRSIEAGEIEDPWREPPEQAYEWTKSISATPDNPLYIEIGFQEGCPVTIDGEDMGLVDLITYLNGVAGQHGIGRIDHLESRVVGFKSRELYEAPAACVLHIAHKALEHANLSRDQLRFKERMAQEYSDLVYGGLWFTAHRRDLKAYTDSTQRFITGDVRVRLHKGTCTVVGRQSPYSLYSYRIATYDKSDQFDHIASKGFIQIYGLSARTEASIHPIDMLASDENLTDR